MANPAFECSAVLTQRGQRVECGIVEHGGDLGQRQAELAIEEDLLQPQQFLLAVIAIAVGTDMAGLQQADRIIMMQRPDADARRPCDLPNRTHSRSEETTSELQSLKRNSH